jgi:hypothetical protein
MSQPVAGWVSAHLYYHGDLDLLLRNAVAPLLGELAAMELVDRFFFVRYGLGGPQVRLRLRLRHQEPRSGERVERQVEAFMRSFFSHHPSLQPLPEEEIRRRNRIILANDPFESDDRVHPDGSVSFVPFLAEVERFGGAAHLPVTLDFFALSSLLALEDVVHHPDPEPNRRLARQLRCLAAQAQGFAASPPDFLALVSNAAFPPGDRHGSALAKAERVASELRTELESLLLTQLEASRQAASAVSGPVALGRGACHLAAALGSLSPTERTRVSVRQMHMTANRLGLSNVEESYAARILLRSAEGLLARGGLPEGFLSNPETRESTPTAAQAALACLVEERLLAFLAVGLITPASAAPMD